MCLHRHVHGQSGGSASLIQADNQVMMKDKLVASGNVEISWDDYRIYADYVEFNQETKEIIARGRVTMTSGETVISGEKLQFNLEDKSGLLFDVYGQMPPTVRYKTEKLNHVDSETLTFEKIDFTSCSQCVPRWKITCSKGKIKKEKYIQMKHAVLKIKKIPVFYIPYLRYPLDKNGRATGFLFPGLGTSSLRGFFMLNSFYWDISDNVDLTLGFDYYGKAGMGFAEELRYLTRKMEGNVRFYYFKYKPDVVLPPGATAPKDRFSSNNPNDYLLNITHNQEIDFLDTRLIISVDKQSDANFLRLFNNDFDSVLRRISRSSISLSSSISNVKLSANAAQQDTYYTFNNSARTLRYLPKLAVNLNQQRIWKLPGYFSLDASYTDVQRIGRNYENPEYDQDVGTQRLSFNPSYSLKLMQAPWLSARLALKSKQTIYFKSKDPETGDAVDESLHLGYNSAEVDIKGPVFSRIFEFGGSKIKHLVEPGITMRYVTALDPDDTARLLRVDNFDFPAYSFVGFSLTNRLLLKGKKQKSAREILSLVVSQDYYFDTAAAHRNRRIKGMFPEFSELQGRLRIRPFKSFSLDASVRYNYYLDAPGFLDNFTRIRLNVSYNNRKSFLWGNFNYSRYVNPYVKSNYVFNRDIIGGRLNFDLPRFPLKFNANVNYDITGKQFRHASFKLDYDYQCIIFSSELRLFRYGGRTETQFNVGFSFGNLGKVKDFLGVDD